MKKNQVLNKVNELLNTNFETIDWVWISEKKKLSENFIREFKDEVDWWRISSKQKLSEDFIREFQRKVDWKWISCKQKLSEDFIREYVFKIDFDSTWNKYEYPW